MDRVFVRCAGCGRTFETARFGQIDCPTCRAKIWLEPPAALDPPESMNPPLAPAPEPPAPSVIELEPVPAESSGAQSFEEDSSLAGFLRTLRALLTAPALFFSGIGSRRYGRALLFGWATATIGIFLWLLTQYLLFDPVEALKALRARPELVPTGLSPEGAIDTLQAAYGFGLILSPIFGLTNLWLSALLNHVGVMLAFGQHSGFRATAKVTAYACAPLLFLLVPEIGTFVGTTWAIALQMIGLSRVHFAPIGRAALAVLLPFSVILLMMLLLNG